MMFRRCPPGGGQSEKKNVKYLPCLVSNDHYIYHGPQNNDYLKDICNAGEDWILSIYLNF
jgi:hypothetical protein